MRRRVLLAISALAIAASGGFAQAQALGATFSQVRLAYAGAKPVQVDEAKALELHDVDYAGFRWKTVDFIFNSAGGLDHLTMTSDIASYDAVLEATSARMSEVPAISTAAAPGGRDMQIRVCERRGGGVTVTYEAVPTLS